MYTLLRNVQIKQALAVETPTLISSLVIAELFYKFHSFTLECLAFLATWFVISAVLSFMAKLFPQAKPSS